MDISHITNLLSSLGKNQVNIPIIENDFIETKVDLLYTKLFAKNEFDTLDDITAIIKHQKSYSGNVHQMNKKVQLSNKDLTNKNSLHKKVESVIDHQNRYNLIYTLACVKDNNLIFEKHHEKIIQRSITYLNDLLNFINNSVLKKIGIEELNNEKTSKQFIIQQLTRMLDDKCYMKTSLTSFEYELLIKLSSKYLQKQIALYNHLRVIIYSEYDQDSKFDDVVVIKKAKDSELYCMEDILKTHVFKDKFTKENIETIKSQINYQENLKSLSVKDLRQTAKNICVDIVDTHTGKLYSKGDLRLLIEAKIRTAN
jgi:hypothetical protein